MFHLEGLMNSSMVDWATLPRDLLNLISKSLESSFDVTHFRSVCSSWRSAAEPKPPLPIHHIPLLPNDIIIPDIVGLCLTQQSIVLIKPHNTSDDEADLFGWLVKVEEDLNGTPGKVTLLDPLSDEGHSLPQHFPPSLDMSKFKVKELGREFKLHKCNAVGDIVHSFYLVKSLVKYLDASSDAGGSYKFVLLILQSSGILSVFTSWDRAWTVFNDMPYHYDDVILFDGRFFAVDHEGRTVLVDFETLKLELVVNPVYGGNKKFLVESCGEMLLVDIYLGMEEVDRFVVEDINDFVEKEVKFKVYKFMEKEKSWKIELVNKLPEYAKLFWSPPPWITSHQRAENHRGETSSQS